MAEGYAMSIEDWRKRIDEIDVKLLQLLNERTRCVIEVGKIKKAQNVRIYDPEREREILRRMKEQNRGPLDEEGLQRLFERVIDECRRIERNESEK
jgi:chorismate mutase-like protein